MNNTDRFTLWTRRLVLSLVFAASFLFCGHSRTAPAANNKAIVICASQEDETRADETRWMKNGATNVCRAFRANPEYELSVIADLKSDGLDALESGLSAKPENTAKYGTLVVYLAGYIVPAKPGDGDDLRFALADYDSAGPTQGSISLRELCSKIAKTPATTRLLVLDTFALNDSVDTGRVASDTFKGCGSLYLMACSENGFCGRFWKEQETSLFAYWFAEALQGSADRSLDGKISLPELSAYMTMCVGNLSTAMGTPQKLFLWQLKPSGTPAPLGNSGPVIASPRPENQVDSINRIADQMQAVIPHYGMNRIAIPEFTMAQGSRIKNAKPEFAGLPALMAKDMEGRLISKLTTDRCVVLPTDQLQEKMNFEKIEPESLLSEQSRAVLTKTMVDGKPLSSIIVGFFKKTNSLSYTCGLVDVATMKPLLVTSSIVDTEAREIDGDNEITSDYPVTVQVKNRQGEFEDRKIHFINDRAYVALQKNEIYQVVLWNLTDDTVGFRLLVDGMNTLPEKATAIVPGRELPGEFSTMKSRQGEYVSQKQVPLREANFWVLKPSPKREGDSLSGGAKVKGFYITMGQNTTYREFVVSGADESKASLAGYTNELGMITVGIYSLRPKTRASLDLGMDSAELGTREGTEKKDQDIKAFKGMEVDETKSLLHIRYISPENLQLLLMADQNR